MGTSRLALDGGDPVRSTPLPTRFIGTRWIGEEEKREVLEALDRRALSRVSGMEPPTKVAEFERELCRWTGSPHALGVTSGTAALEVALAGLGIGPGDEVIMPALNFISSPEAVLRLGAVPVFAEIDESFGIDPGDVERRITPATRAIMPLHVHGAACQIDAICGIARRRGLLVLENAAWSLGASLGGKAVGTHGDAGIYSLQSVKVLTAGEGGVVVMRDRAVHERAVRYHDHGNFRGEADPGMEPFIGAAFRMPELVAAVALAQLRKLDSVLVRTRAAHRRIVAGAQALAARIADVPFTLRRVPDPEGDCGIAFGMVLRSREQAAWFQKALTAEGVPVSPLYGARPVYLLPQMQSLRPVWGDRAPLLRGAMPAYPEGLCPRSEDLMARLLVLSVTPDYTPEDADDAVRALEKVASAVPNGL